MIPLVSKEKLKMSLILMWMEKANPLLDNVWQRSRHWEVRAGSTMGAGGTTITNYSESEQFECL